MAGTKVTRRGFFGHTAGAYTAITLGVGATATATGIEDLFYEWRRVASDPGSFDRYPALQARIVNADPQTPKELAMQIYAEMDAGQSELSETLWQRIASLATA